MRKNFWPLFIIAAALGAAAVWTQTPRYVTMLPDGMRSVFRSYVRSAQGLGDIKEQIAAQTEEKDKPVTLLAAVWRQLPRIFQINRANRKSQVLRKVCKSQIIQSSHRPPLPRLALSHLLTSRESR